MTDNDMVDARREKNLTSIIVATAFSFTLLFFIPVNLFITNIVEFSIQLWEILAITIPLSLVGIVVLTFLSRRVDMSLHKKIAVIFGILAVLFWMEANFMPWKLGMFDGRNVEWNKVPYYLYFDISVWIIFIGIGLCKTEKVYKIIKEFSLIVIITQLIFLGIGIYNAPPQMQSTKYNLDYRKHYELSSKKNVIILVLDGAQTDVFQELLNEDPQYKELFNNFTYFRDNLGGYYGTSLSIPLILTGKYYDNSVYIEDYLQSAYRNSLPSLLKKHNYDVGLYPTVKYTLLYDHDVFDNFTERKAFDALSMNELLKVYKTVMPLKATPYIVKRLLLEFNLTTMSVAEAAPTTTSKEPNLTFINELKNSITLNDEMEVFRYYHLMGVHPPLGLDRNLNTVSSDYNRENYKEQYRGVLKITGMFLQELKDEGIYDDSMIIIMADHGSWLSSFNQKASGLNSNNDRETKYPFEMASSHPLLLIKRFNSKEPFKISDALVTSGDIPRTVAEELDFTNDLPGQSIFNISEDQERERTYYRGILKPDFKSTSFVEYKVNGNSWLDESWKKVSADNGPEASEIILGD